MKKREEKQVINFTIFSVLLCFVVTRPIEKQLAQWLRKYSIYAKWKLYNVLKGPSFFNQKAMRCQNL